MTSAITDRLAVLAARPREWRVTTHYAGGATKAHDTHNEAGANNYALGERRKLRRDLIDRATGATVCVTIARI
jgi:hypothetical protein